MNYKIIATNPTTEEALTLTNELHADLDIRYGQGRIEEFTEENSLMIYFLTVYDENNYSAACGALKHYNDDTVEIKRMFVRKEFRGKGLSKLILKELEKHAKKLKYKKIILETGYKQPEAVNLYKKFGYTEIECYAHHSSDPDSVCFEKNISK